MLNVSSALMKMGINHKSVIQGTQDVGNRLRDSVDQCAESRKIFQTLLDRDVVFDDDVYARICTKALIREVISAGCDVDEPDLFIEEAREYAITFCADPKWSFLWANPDNEVSSIKIERTAQVVDDIDIKVAVHEDGKIKKGGKTVLSQALFDKHVLNTTTPLTGPEFIALLMKELDFSKAGATTYNFNLRKAAGLTRKK